MNCASCANSAGLAIDGALFGFLHYVVPPSISRIVDSAGFFALLGGGGGMALGAYVLMPRLAHCRLVAAPSGHSSGHFPRFTRWARCGTSRSFQLADSFECSRVENEYELAATFSSTAARSHNPRSSDTMTAHFPEA
jgi:hypothetical protein